MTVSAEAQTVEELYLRHHVALRRFLTRMLRCEEAAAEVAQEAYVRLLRFTSGRTMDNPRAYLFQVAANAARDYLARERTRNGVVDDGKVTDTIPCTEPNADALIQARQRMDILIEAVNELPSRCREVFLLSRLDNLSNAEIAAKLGISRNMVEKHIIKAMTYCRRSLTAAGN